MPGPSQLISLKPAKLLVRGVNWLGDAVMTTPALQRLRQRFPHSQICLLTNEKLADLWQGHPAIDQILTFNGAESPWTIAGRLRGRGFDAALILPNSPRAALEVWLGRIPHRIGYARRWRNWFLSLPVRLPDTCMTPRRRSVREIRRLTSPAYRPPASDRHCAYRHQIHDYLQLAAALGADPSPLPPRLELSPGELESSVTECLAASKHAIIRNAVVPNPILLGLNPSAAYGPAKCWPVERYAEVMREVSKRIPSALCLVFGTASDWEICERIVSSIAGRAVNLAGKTSLRQLMALLKQCQVLVTNDSGPMHVAAALDTPVVVPFGSTSPELTGPGEPGDRRHRLLRNPIPCAPCFRRTCPIDFRCMLGISVQQMVSAVLDAVQCAGCIPKPGNS